MVEYVHDTLQQGQGRDRDVRWLNSILFSTLLFCPMAAQAQRAPLSDQAADALYVRARSLQLSHRAAESLAMFTRAAKLRPPTAEDLRFVALDYVLLKSNTEALRWLAESLKLDRNNAETWYDLARVDMTLEDYGKADIAIRQALALAPTMSKGENNRGLILEALNRPDEALAAYRHAVVLQQEQHVANEQPLINLGLLLSSRGNDAEARPLLEEAAKIAPADSRALAALAHARAETGDLNGAIESLVAALRHDERNARLHFQLGQVYRRQGDAQKAAAELRLSQQLYGSQSSEQATKP